MSKLLLCASSRYIKSRLQFETSIALVKIFETRIKQR